MADIDWDDVEAIAPELSTVSADAQTMILAYVNDALDVSLFGGEDAAKTKLIRVYMAAHRGAMTQRNGVGGSVSSQSVGGISRSYGTVGGGADDYNSTAYGQEYLSLIRNSPARIACVWTTTI